jgi:hypothetical protein
MHFFIPLIGGEAVGGRVPIFYSPTTAPVPLFGNGTVQRIQFMRLFFLKKGTAPL